MSNNSNKLIAEINANVNKLYEIGDKDECSDKNLVNGFCSIYFFNDLNHLIDYSSNGHNKKDTEKFIELWNEILCKVKNLKIEDRQFIIGNFINKNYWFYDYYLNNSFHNFDSKKLSHNFDWKKLS